MIWYKNGMCLILKKKINHTDQVKESLKWSKPTTLWRKCYCHFVCMVLDMPICQGKDKIREKRNKMPEKQVQITTLFLKEIFNGTWVAQSAECLTIDSCSGHDPTIRETESHVRLHANHRACLRLYLSHLHFGSLLCSCSV